MGCSKLDYDSPYNAEYNRQSLDEMTEKTKPFAYNLCITDKDIMENTNVDMTEIGATALFDLSKKEIIYAKNPHTELSPASLTKIMTALVALKYGSLDMTITVDKPIVFNEYGVVKMDLEEGDELTLDQALHALLMCSANDVAVAIAREIGGDVEGFCDLMNKEALNLGATNTHFVNPHGLTEENHYTCVYDLYLIFQEVMQYSKFNDIIHSASYSTSYKDKNGDSVEFECKNSNKFLVDDSVKSPENITVLGGKTGTTNAAGHCLIIHSKDNANNSYISVILNAPERETVYVKMIELLQEIN